MNTTVRKLYVDYIRNPKPSNLKGKKKPKPLGVWAVYLYTYNMGHHIITVTIIANTKHLMF